jgi:ABC-type multidrug transport system fused ATPase/permease subunit
MGDIEALPAADGTERWAARLAAELARARRGAAGDGGGAAGARAPGLGWLLLRLFARDWLLIGVFQVGCVAAALLAPLALGRVLTYVEGSSGSGGGGGAASTSTPWAGLGWAATMGAVQLFAAASTTQFN